MSKTSLPFHSNDISALARALGGQLAACGRLPSHLELLNMLARAQGCRNFQHLRALALSRAALDAPPPAPEPVDTVRVRRVLRLYDPRGVLSRWPPKLWERELCLWGLWAALPADRTLAEAEVNRLLTGRHAFGDYALLRRWLCDLGLVTRTPSGSEYRRVERRPPADARALIGLLSRRVAAPAEDAGA